MQINSVNAKQRVRFLRPCFETFATAYKRWETANKNEMPYAIRESLWEQYCAARDALVFKNVIN